MNRLICITLIFVSICLCRNIFAEDNFFTRNYKEAQKTASKEECIANMKQIVGAIAVWKLDKNAPDGARPTKSDLIPDYLKSWPTCQGKEYVVPAVDENPKCPNNIEGHVFNESAKDEIDRPPK